MGNNIKDNLEKKTREVVDIRMSNFDWNFLQLWFDMLGLCWLTWKFCMFSTSVTALRFCVLVVDNSVDGKDNQEEEIMEVGDIMMYH